MKTDMNDTSKLKLVTPSAGRKPDATLSTYKTPARETRPLPGGTPGWYSVPPKDNPKEAA